MISVTLSTELFMHIMSWSSIMLDPHLNQLVMAHDFITFTLIRVAEEIQHAMLQSIMWNHFPF